MFMEILQSSESARRNDAGHPEQRFPASAAYNQARWSPGKHERRPATPSRRSADRRTLCTGGQTGTGSLEKQDIHFTRDAPPSPPRSSELLSNPSQHERPQISGRTIARLGRRPDLLMQINCELVEMFRNAESVEAELPETKRSFHCSVKEPEGVFDYMIPAEYQT